MNALDFLSLCGNNYDITLTIMLRDWRGEHTGRFREIFHYVFTQVDKNDDIMSWKIFSYDKEPGKKYLVIILFSSFTKEPVRYHGQDDLDCPF